MKRLLLALLLIPGLAQAQDRGNVFSTRAIRQFGLALTDSGLFGVPRYTTTLRPACTSSNVGALIRNLTTNTYQGCDGSSWGSLAGVAFGGASGGTATRVLFSDGSGNLADDADLTFSTDTLTATKIGSTTMTGTNVLTGRNTFGSAADAANSIDIGGTNNCITFEGTAADAFEGLFCGGNAGLDTTTSIPHLTATQTIALLEGSQTITGAKTFNAAPTFAVTPGAMTINDDGLICRGTACSVADGFNTSQTPDTMWLGLGTAANTLMVGEAGDRSFSFGNGPCGSSACTNPTVLVRDKDQNATDYIGVAIYGLAGKSVTTLTESAATSTMRIPVAANAGTGGTYYYTIFATDGTDPQVRQGRVIFSVTNKAATENCVLGTPEETDNTPTGTLTVTVTCDNTPANAVDIQLNAVSSLSQTTLEAYSRIDLVGPGEPLPQ